MSVCLGRHNDIPQTGCLKKQKCISHGLGEWTSGTRGAGVAGGRSDGSHFGLEMAIFSLSVHLAFPQCMCREREREMSGVSFSSRKTTSPIRSGPHPLTSFNLNYFLQALSPNTVALGVRASTCDFGKGIEFGP